MGWRQWTSGQLVTAPDFQSYVQDQTILKFATAAARTAALPSPTSGMFSWLEDVERLEVFSGGAWRKVVKGFRNGTDPEIDIYFATFTVKIGTAVVTTDSNGEATITFRRAFATAASFCLGAPSSGMPSTVPYMGYINTDSLTASTVKVRCMQYNGSAVNAMAVRWSYLIVGTD